MKKILFTCGILLVSVLSWAQQISGTSCPQPHSLTIFTQSEDSLVLDWQGDAEKYEVGCYSYGNDTWHVDRVATNQYVFTEVQEVLNRETRSKTDLAPVDFEVVAVEHRIGL